MSRNIKLSNLLPVKNALKRKPSSAAVSITYFDFFYFSIMCLFISSFQWKTSPEVVSPYFSPIKTRNQRKHIVIQTEETLKNKPISKIATKAILKQETIDAIETFASTSKPTQKVPVERPNVKIETIDTVNKKGKVDVIDKLKSPKSNPKPKVVAFKDEVIKKETANAISVNDDEAMVDGKWQPKNWKQMIENIREMRKKRSAPVDTMGCHKCSDENASEKVMI